MGLVVADTESWTNSVPQSCEDTDLEQRYPSGDNRESEISL